MSVLRCGSSTKHLSQALHKLKRRLLHQMIQRVIKVENFFSRSEIESFEYLYMQQRLEKIISIVMSRLDILEENFDIGCT